MLSLARSLFQEQMSLERLVSTIITEAKELLKCERCTVYLLELKMYDQVGIRLYRITLQKEDFFPIVVFRKVLELFFEILVGF